METVLETETELELESVLVRPVLEPATAWLKGEALVLILVGPVLILILILFLFLILFPYAHEFI